MGTRVSIIITTYNRSALLPRVVESARLAGSDVEIIIVDDASEDGTREVCESIPNTHYIRLRHRLGVSSARNLGVLASTSEYISFLDDDDVRLPGSIDRQVALLEAAPAAGMIYGRVLYGDEECRPKGGSYPEDCPQGDIFWNLLRWNFIPCQSVIFRRDCLLRIGLLDETVPGLDDWDLWVRLAELYPVLAVEDAVAIWRQPTFTSDQMSLHSERMHRHARRLHKKKWLRLPRCLDATERERRKIACEFAEYAAQQLIWEAVPRLKARRVGEFARITAALFTMHPVTGIRLAFGPPTWRFFGAAFRKRQEEALN